MTVLAGSVVAVLIALVATAAPASAGYANIATDTPLRLINYSSLACVQPVAGIGVPLWESGAPIQQEACGYNVPNYWTAHYIGEVSTGYCNWYDLFCGDEFKVYQFSSNYSGKCLDISGESTSLAAMQQTTCTAGDRSTYWMVWDGAHNGTVTVQNFFSWLCLDTSSTAVHAQVQQRGCTNSPTQNFYYS
jgi:hypothetical protein